MAGKKQAPRQERERRPFSRPMRYDQRTVREEREYGVYWYAWLWRVLRPVTVFFCAVCEHRPGSLLTLLKVFSDEGINLTCVESRPIRGVLGEYRFFIALAGDIADGRIRGALERARGVCRTFRILGAYL